METTTTTTRRETFPCIECGRRVEQAVSIKPLGDAAEGYLIVSPSRLYCDDCDQEMQEMDD